MNTFQKIVLLLYGISFAFFSIVKVPFKIRGSVNIVYDTLFSNRANIDIGRMTLIIVMLTIAAALLFVLTINLKLNIEFHRKIKAKFLLYVGGIYCCHWMVYIFLNNRNNKSTDSLPVSIIQRIDTPNIPTTNKIVTQEDTSGNNNNYDDIYNEKKHFFTYSYWS